MYNFVVKKNNGSSVYLVGVDELFNELRIAVSDNGQIFIGGLLFNISYDMKEYTKPEVYKDLLRNYLGKLGSMVGAEIYKLEKL